MKPRILICSIIRNGLGNLPTWFNQILSLQSFCDPNYTFYLSVVENDSSDGTAEWLQQELPLLSGGSFVGRGTVTCEKLGTQQYTSVWSVDRMRNLASARQRCLSQADAKWGLDSFHKVAYVEPDVVYNPTWISELILADHPRAAGVGEPDIYSGWSLRSEAHPKESTFLYDTCATRQTDKDLCWNFARDGDGTWRGESLVKTPFTGFQANCLHSLWSTFNGFCVYRTEPFLRGARWGYVNTRLNTGQQYIDDGDSGSGWLDADTSIMCERFRKMGYNGVYLNTNCLIRHLT